MRRGKMRRGGRARDEEGRKGKGLRRGGRAMDEEGRKGKG